MRKGHTLFSVMVMAAGCCSPDVAEIPIYELPVVTNLEVGMDRSMVASKLPRCTTDGNGGLLYDTTLADGTRIEAYIQIDGDLLSNVQIDFIPSDQVASDSLFANLVRHYDKSSGKALRDGDYLIWTRGTMALELADESATYGTPHVSLTLYPTFSR